MQTQTIAPARAGPPTMSVILLPGAYHRPEQFLQAGFDRALHERAPGVQLILTAPQLAHLTDRHWLAELHQVVTTARSGRDTPVWLGGISLGGFMALRFAAQYPEVLDGLCLLAPYLGSRIIAAEIATFADIADWRPGTLDADDDERRIWQYVAQLRGGLTATRVFVGFGSDDRFADTQRLLARMLASERNRTLEITGDHDWPVWRELWTAFLDMYGEQR